MATEVAHLLAKLSANTSQFDRAMRQSETRVGKFGAVAKRGLAAAGTGLVVLGGISVRNASNLEEQINKTAVVFRGSEKDILSWSTTTASGLGISQRAALEAAGTFGNMLVPMGFAREEAGKMSTRMVTLAADMASFNNASPEETLDALRSGLAGETEPLRRFGVFLNDARLKQEAMNMGLYEGKGALDANAKAQATYSLILKDSKDAQGDFQRTSGSMANQQRILRAEFEDVTAQLGKELLPIVTEVLRVLVRFIRWASGVNGAEKFANAWRAVVDVWDEIKVTFTRFALWMQRKALELVLDIVEPFSHLPGRMGQWARDAKDRINRQLDRVIEKVNELDRAARRASNRKYNITFVTNAAKVKSDIEDMTATARSAASRTYQGPGGDFGSFGMGRTSLVALGRQLQSMGFDVGEHPAFGGVSPVHVPGSYHYSGRALDINWPGGGAAETSRLDWLHSRLSRMPGIVELLWRTAGHMSHLHVAMDRGGVVPGPRGAPVPVLAHGGETFIPTHRPGVGVGNTVINVGGLVVDGEKLMRLIEQANKVSGRRGGPKLQFGG